MGRQRHSCCPKKKFRKGLWSPEEDAKLFNHVTSFGIGSWSCVPKLAGLQRCGKSCRLRWINYLRPDLKRGMFSQEEEDLILSLHKILGNRWAQIATRMPGRTDNEIKNFWNSCLKKKLMKQGIDPATHGSLPAVKKEETNTENKPLVPNYGSVTPFHVTDNVYHESKHFATEQSVLDPLHSFACNPVAADPDGRSKMMESDQGRPNFVAIDQPRLPSSMPVLVDSDHHPWAEFSDDRLDSRMNWSLFDSDEAMKFEEAEGSAWELGQLLHMDYGLPSFSSTGEDDDGLTGGEF